MLKLVFDGGCMHVTTLGRVHVKMVFVCICFDLL